MKKFTLNDFLNYFPTCLSCQRQTEFCLISEVQGLFFKKIPIITSASILIPIEVNYSKSSELEILRKSNKLIFTNLQPDHFENKRYLFRVSCSFCRSIIDTQYLEFDFTKNILKPFALYQELLSIRNDNQIFYIDTNFKTPIKTKIEIFSFKNSSFPSLDFTISVKEFPKYKFKTLDTLFKKIRTFENFQ